VCITKSGFLIFFCFPRYGRIIRFKNNKDRWNYVADDGNLLWENKAACVTTATKCLRHYMNTFTLPIAIFVGQKSGIGVKGYGHAWGLILHKNAEDQWNAVIKDSLPANDANVPSLAVSLCYSLGIKTINLVSQLVTEEEKTGLDCIGEAFRVIGDTLDGKYPNAIMPYVVKLYDVKKRKYFAV
jgi:hypothetical protein